MNNNNTFHNNEREREKKKKKLNLNQPIHTRIIIYKQHQFFFISTLLLLVESTVDDLNNQEIHTYTQREKGKTILNKKKLQVPQKNSVSPEVKFTIEAFFFLLLPLLNSNY